MSEMLTPRFPEGTPEYAAYAAELRAELAKFAKGEDPYPYPAAPRATLIDQAPFDANLWPDRSHRPARKDPKP